MSLLDRVLGGDVVTVRQYLATLIGPLRAPFGQRRSAPVAVGQTVPIALNKTTDRVLFVTVSRADGAGQTQVIFSGADTPSTNDFVVVFANAGVFRFTLKPGEQLSMLNQAGAAISLVFTQETY